MGMKVQYVGPKDGKTFKGQFFPRLVPVDVPDTKAAELLAYPDVFLPADQEVPEEVLAQRYKLGAALIAEGEYHKDQYTASLYAAKAMKPGSIDEKTGKPDWEMQQRLDSIAGAQSQIDHANSLIKQGEEWNRKVAAERAALDDEGSPTVRRGRKVAEAV